MTLRARDPRFFEPLWTAEQARALDKSTIEAAGIPGYVLMEHAGRAVADVVTRLCNGKSLRPVLIFTGPGNNGGDGWVAARHLWGLGIPALVLSTCKIETLKGDAAQAAQSYDRASGMMEWGLPGINKPWLVVTQPHQLSTYLQTFQPHVIVDALLGTGLSRPLEGIMAEWVACLTDGAQTLPERPKIVAVDVPTGMFTEGHQSSSLCLDADVTVTFGGRKICHALSPLCFRCGEVINANIGLLPSVAAVASARAFVLRDHRPFLRDILSPPKQTAHKGDFGHVAVWLGAETMQGASQLATYGAHRAASGKVTLLGSADSASNKPTISPETLWATIPNDTQEAETLMGQFSALVAGPGVSQTKREQGIVAELIRLAMRTGTPIVADAGGLGALALLENDERQRRSFLICTPHPKEAARLLGLSTAEVQADRLGAMDKLCDLPINDVCHVIWVLKGANCVLGEKQSASVIVPGGNSALAVGGSGDVLAGVIAALVTRVPDPFLGVVAAVFAHQQGGRQLGSLYQAGFLAREIADAVQKVLFSVGGAS